MQSSTHVKFLLKKQFLYIYFLATIYLRVAWTPWIWDFGLIILNLRVAWKPRTTMYRELLYWTPCTRELLEHSVPESYLKTLYLRVACTPCTWELLAPGNEKVIPETIIERLNNLDRINCIHTNTLPDTAPLLPPQNR